MAWLAPVSTRIFVVGVFAVTACPPFGPFFSELRIVRAGLETGCGWAIAIFIGCLTLAFFGLTRLVFALADGRPRQATVATGKRFRESAGVIVPPLILLGLSLWLGLATPTVLRETWTSAVQALSSP
jgi:hydrogenase-4 component F